ncbi:MAG: Peptidase family, partial [Spartobacteria bacterium]|nr:Peptidase family [Spartobacteria bacterium]
MATRKKETVPAASSNVIKGAEPYQPKMSAATSKSIIKSEVGQRVKLSVYRSTVTPLTPTERELIIDQALAMLERTYAHLPLKRALHANDPIQSLKLLRLRHSALEERAFQSAVMDVFLGLRDLHTNYILPNAYRSKFAFVPFRIEEFYEPGGVVPNPASPAPQRSYVVSWVSPVNTVSTLKEGMVVTHWNGSPIDLAVARNGAREAGSNLDARRAQGVEALTLRWLGMSLPPDEDWVMLTYTDGTHAFESRFDWEINESSDRQSLLSGLSALAASGKTPTPVGVDQKRMLLDRVRKQVFDPQAVKVEDEMAKRLDKLGAKAMAEPLRAETSNFPDVFPRFGTVDTPSGKFGYIRLKSFAPENHMGNVVWDTVNEFIRILKTLPPSGLILDVRGNGGGYINIGELILQTLTPRDITPEGFHFLATSTTLAMASKANNGIGEWKDSILEGLESGASFSRGFPLTDPSDCNLIGQVYQGPVILITDALCY